jgi:hypothetical protein
LFNDEGAAKTLLHSLAGKASKLLKVIEIFLKFGTKMLTPLNVLL